MEPNMDIIHPRSDSVVATHLVSTDVEKIAQVTTASVDPESCDLQQLVCLQQNWQNRHIHRWKSPLLMVTFFLVGLAMSLAHCIFYSSMRDKIVGNSDAQEEKIR